MAEALRLAREFLALAERHTADADQMVGHRLLGTTLFLVGDTEQAYAELSRATRLYDPERHTIALSYGSDAHVINLSNLCIVCWHLGQVGAALVHAETALNSALKLGQAHTLGYAVTHICMLHTLEINVRQVSRLAGQMLVQATEREVWRTVARIYLGWCEMGAGNIQDAIDIMKTEGESLDAANLIYWKPTYLCWLAEAYIRAGMLNGASNPASRCGSPFRLANFWR